MIPRRVSDIVLAKMSLSMMKKMIFAAMFSWISAFAAENPIGGFWIIPDSDTGKPESVAYFYESGGTYTARMVLIYDEDTGKVAETFLAPKERAKGINSHPYICGLVFIWDLKPESDGKYAGKVVNPDSGHVFKCEVWYDATSKKLAVRGELLIFGQTNFWLPIAADKLPEDVVQAAAKFSRGEGAPAPELSGNPPSGDSVKPRREKPRFYRARN